MNAGRRMDVRETIVGAPLLLYKFDILVTDGDLPIRREKSHV